MTPVTSPAPVLAWRAQWLAAPGRPAWTDFPTREQAELFAVRRHGCPVEVIPVAGPVGGAALRAVPHRSPLGADRFDSLVEGQPPRTAEERQLLDVVAGLRRVAGRTVPPHVSRGIRERLLSPAG